VGLELQSSFIFKSHSDFNGSSDAQPLGLNSIVDPSWCLHLKEKFLDSATSKLVSLIAFGGGILASTLRTTAAPLFEGQVRQMPLKFVPNRPMILSESWGSQLVRPWFAILRTKGVRFPPPAPPNLDSIRCQIVRMDSGLGA
jgi:hypothetical protein